MVDFNKIAKAVQNTIKEIAKTEGNKKKIDSAKEFMMLGNYLAGNAQNMNVHERDYIAGLMIEYQEKAFEENVTDSTKDVVKAIAKRTYDKKKIDSDEEAFALATLLKNSKGDLNRADLEYIKQVLIKNGYGHYLEMFNPPPTVQLPQEPVYPPTEGQGEDNTANKTDISKDKFEDSDTTTQVGEPQVKEEPSVNKKPKKITEKPTKQEPDKDVTKPIEEPSQEITMFDHAVISEKGRTEGMVIAQKILDEFDSMIVDNDKIKEYIGEINNANAFTVLTAVKKGVEKGINEKTLIDTKDPFNTLTMRESHHIAECLLGQAAQMGLGLTKEFKALQDERNRIDTILDHDSKADPSKEEATDIDKKIAKLLNLMNQVVYETDRDGSYKSRDENKQGNLKKLVVGAEFLKKFGKNYEKLTKNSPY